MACSRLEEIANSTRSEMLGKNLYNEEEAYSSVHPNATQAVGSNDVNNVKGKGTGVAFDTTNGGSSVDINGSSAYYGSGRKGIYYVNKYNPENQYNCFITNG